MMPIYEYQCELCAHQFETMQKISEAPLKTCPACSQDSLRKKVSAAGFRLKGGGWYETDFKKGGDKKRNLETGGTGSEGGAASSGSTSTAAGSDSGSATKGGDTAAATKAPAGDSSA